MEFLEEDKNSTILSEIVHLEKMKGYFGNCFKVTTICINIQHVLTFHWLTFVASNV